MFNSEMIFAIVRRSLDVDFKFQKCFKKNFFDVSSLFIKNDKNNANDNIDKSKSIELA